MSSPIKRKPGRPTDFREAYVAQAIKLCELGATDVELADFFEVKVRTIYRWAVSIPEFSQALKSGKDVADERVTRSLYHRAIGYTHDAVKIFQVGGVPLIVPYQEHVPPDTTACIFWLKNRRKDQWRDVHKHEIGGEGAFDGMTDAELAKFIKASAAETSPGGGGAEESPPPSGARGPGRPH